MSILSTPLQGVLSSPLSSPLFSGSMWWLVFDQNANFAYDLSSGRYMRSGGASTQALSLTEDRASSAMVLQGNGNYVERAAGELAIGQGVGLQVSEAVTNLLRNSDLTGAAVGAIPGTGSLPTGWALSQVGSGLSYEVTEIGTLLGLPSLKLHVFGTAGSSAQMFVRGASADTNSIPVVLGDKFAISFATRLAGGSLNGVNQAWVDLALWNASGGFTGRPTLNNREEFSKTNLSDAALRYSLWVEIEDTDAAYIDPTINLKFGSGEVVDLTLEIAAYNCTAGGAEYPVIIGAGTDFTRAADNPVVVQGVGGVPWDGYDLATGVTFQQVFSPSDTGGIEAFTFSDGTSDNYLIVRRGAGGGVEIEAYLAGVLTFSAESSTAFPTNLAAIELYMKQGATVTVALDGVILSDITQAGKTLADYSQVSLSCGAGTSTITEIYGK